MIVRSTWILLVVWTIVSADSVAGQDPVEGAGALPAEVRSRLEAVIAQHQAQQKIPGISIAVMDRGRLVYSEGFGMADLENAVPASARTVYRTASIAKPLTAAAVMQLWERQLLDLDAPIQRYCPEYPQKPWMVTCRQLLGHLGGVRHYHNGAEASGTARFDSISASVRLFSDDPLRHEPGTAFGYTTYGYTLLGRAVETVSESSYAEYMTRHIFAPAGMHHTTIDDQRRIIARRAGGYVRVTPALLATLPEAERGAFPAGTVVHSTLHDTSMKIPGGGLVSTAEDLARFGRAMLAGDLVERPTRDLMWTRQTLADGSSTSYGLGWNIGDDDGIAIIQHSGGQSGTATLLVIVPELELVVAAMCNLQGAQLRTLVREIGMKVHAELSSD